MTVSGSLRVVHGCHDNLCITVVAVCSYLHDNSEIYVSLYFQNISLQPNNNFALHYQCSVLCSVPHVRFQRKNFIKQSS